jgi:hypothetical protein
MEVKSLDPEKEVKWGCMEEPADWIGADISFEWSQQDGRKGKTSPGDVKIDNWN